MDTSAVPGIPLDPDVFDSYLLRADLLLRIFVALYLLNVFHEPGATATRDVQPGGSVVSRVM